MSDIHDDVAIVMQEIANRIKDIANPELDEDADCGTMRFWPTISSNVELCELNLSPSAEVTFRRPMGCKFKSNLADPASLRLISRQIRHCFKKGCHRCKWGRKWKSTR
jgi:hypothetical protein